MCFFINLFSKWKNVIGRYIGYEDFLLPNIVICPKKSASVQPLLLLNKYFGCWCLVTCLGKASFSFLFCFYCQLSEYLKINHAFLLQQAL